MADFEKPFGSCIFCDDIRQEVGGKMSYMGAYYGALFAPSFPFTVSKFAIAVTFFEPLEMSVARTWNVPVKLFVPGDDNALASGEVPIVSKEAIDAQLKSTLPDDLDIPKLVIYQLAFTMAPFIFQMPGRIKMRAIYSDTMIVKLGSLRVELSPQTPNPVASAS